SGRHGRARTADRPREQADPRRDEPRPQRRAARRRPRTRPERRTRRAVRPGRYVRRRRDRGAVRMRRATSAVLRKELRLELRTPQSVPAMALFSITTFVVFHFALQRGELGGDL